MVKRRKLGKFIHTIVIYIVINRLAFSMDAFVNGPTNSLPFHARKYILVRYPGLPITQVGAIKQTGY